MVMDILHIITGAMHCPIVYGFDLAFSKSTYPFIERKLFISWMFVQV